MFGSLKKYKTEDFYKDHQFFTIYTSECAYRYQIFAYYDVPETDEVYTVGFAPDETFQKFIDKMINNQAWKESYIKNKNDERPTYKVELGSGEYLSDIKERFFE